MIKKVVFSPQFYLFFCWNILIALLYVAEQADANELLVIYWANSGVLTLFYIVYLIYRKLHYDDKKVLNDMQQKTIAEVNKEEVVFTPEYLKNEVKRNYTYTAEAVATFTILLVFIFILMYIATAGIMHSLTDYTLVYISTAAFGAGLVANAAFSNWIPTLNKMPNQPIAFIAIARIIPFSVLLIVFYKYLVLGWAFIAAKTAIDFILFMLLEAPYLKKE